LNSFLKIKKIVPALCKTGQLYCLSLVKLKRIFIITAVIWKAFEVPSKIAARLCAFKNIGINNVFNKEKFVNTHNPNT